MKLKVVFSEKGTSGRMIAGLNRETMLKLGVRPGDIIKIQGKRTSYAAAWPNDRIGENEIALDGLMRKNVGVGVGDYVDVEKAQLRDAKKVVFAFPEEIKLSREEEEYVKRVIKEVYMDKPVSVGDVLLFPSYTHRIEMQVLRVLPDKAGIIRPDTQIEITTSKTAANIPQVTYEDIGGLEDAIQKIREMVELPMRHPELFERLGITPPKGVLLYGPPGTGKTLLAKAVANETNASFYHIAGPEIVSKFVGESEQRLRNIFEEAKKNAPSIIFIDELDAIAPKRGETHGDVEKRLVAQLLTLMDGLESRGEVVVIGATNRPDDIDEALRRPGRFDREIEIGIPDTKGRLEILKIHTRDMPLKDVDLEKLAELTHGYTGADLAALAKEAALAALRRYLQKPEFKEKVKEGKITQELLSQIVVTQEDFEEAMKSIQPSALREVYVEKPNVKWEDVGGLEKAKQELQEAIKYSLQFPHILEQYGLTPIRGIVLHGPPGTGKTLLAKAAAGESDANFIAINGPEIYSKWVGESEKTLREIFKKARQAAPTILFIDELDAIAPKRSGADNTRVSERIVNTLLTELDGIKTNRQVLVIGATNRLDMIDPALLRPGRFDKQIEVGIPDEKARLEIFKVHTRNMPLEKDVDLEELAKITEGFTGADIADVVRTAAMTALREAVKSATKEDLKKGKVAIKKVSRKHFIEAIEKKKQQARAKTGGYF
ncbi:MAG: CDC48 family AAA ATPase [Candidatus Micrarchaeota archaeon]|nr:CDC48 family AAA ATPase [Candidatus Micrarchaeota archaeon]